MATKAEQVHERVTELVEGGASQADAFRQVAEETGLKFDSVRGAFYTHGRRSSGTSSRPRRRETTPDDAIADAVKALQRALESIDREIVEAEERAREAADEAKALKASAPERKKAIQAKLDALS